MPRSIVLTLCATMLGLLNACQAPQPIRDDVTAIYYFYQPVPWLRDSDNRVNGFYVTVYFSSAESNRGVFVPGTIVVRMNRVRPLPEGTAERTLAHEWRMTAAEAEGFRVQKRSVMGDHYGFLLIWPPTVDVAGQLVELQFVYERIDGRVIEGAARRFRVPGNPSVRPVQPRGTGRVPAADDSPRRPAVTRFQPGPARTDADTSSPGIEADPQINPRGESAAQGMPRTDRPDLTPRARPSIRQRAAETDAAGESKPEGETAPRRRAPAAPRSGRAPRGGSAAPATQPAEPAVPTSPAGITEEPYGPAAPSGRREPH